MAIIFRLPTFNQVVDVLSFNPLTGEYEERLTDQEAAHYAFWKQAAQVWHQPGYNPLSEFDGGPIYTFFRFPKGVIIFDKKAEDLVLPDVIRWVHEDYGVRYYRVDQVEPRAAGFSNEHVQCSCSLVPASAVAGAAAPPPPPTDPISESLSSLVASPTTQDADGVSQVTLLLTLLKESANPAIGQSGNWITAGDSLLADSTFVTNSAGQATTTATNTTNEIINYEADPTHLTANIASNAVTWENAIEPVTFSLNVNVVDDDGCAQCLTLNGTHTMHDWSENVWRSDPFADWCGSGEAAFFEMTWDPGTETLTVDFRLASGGICQWNKNIPGWDMATGDSLGNFSETDPFGCDWTDATTIGVNVS